MSGRNVTLKNGGIELFISSGRGQWWKPRVDVGHTKFAFIEGVPRLENCKTFVAREVQTQRESPLRKERNPQRAQPMTTLQSLTPTAWPIRGEPGEEAGRFLHSFSVLRAI